MPSETVGCEEDEMSSISGGLSSTAVYNQILKKGQATAVAEFVKSDPTIKRAEEAFKKDVSKYKGPNDLFSHYNDLKFVLTAFGQTSQLDNVGLLKKVVASNLSDSKSLANTLSGGSFKTLTQVLQTDGSPTKSLQDPTVQGQIINAYELAAYQAHVAESNPAVPTALNFASIAKSVKSIYDVLGNSTLRNVVGKVGNIPPQVVNQTVEAQGAAFARIFDVKKASDPNYIQNFVKRYLGKVDAEAAAANSGGGNSITSLFSSGGGSGNGVSSLLG